ncbi:hypothetical protein R0J93_20290, partial [Pseudoalteromonas sp. SIMBA_148]
DKNTSRLPSPIQVTDSSDSNKQSTQAAVAKDTSTDMTASKNRSSHVANHPDQQSALITIEQRTIEKHEQKIHAYTDDPYTYQSVESIPTVLPADTPKLTHDTNSAVDADRTVNNESTSIKISFSPLLDHQSDISRTPA